MSDKTIDIRALAKLARLDLGEAEIEKLEKDVSGILGFVETIQQVDISGAVNQQGLHNVMRSDADPHAPRTFTDALLAGAPRREGNQIAVKQVVSRKKQENSSS